MVKEIFVGRYQELSELRSLLGKKAAALIIVVKGRRRVGKSRLLDEFGRGLKTFKFLGLPPQEETTKQSQIDEFARQLSANMGFPEFRADDWSTLFAVLGKESQQGRVLIIFDEMSWIGSKDPDFLGKLKNAWDDIFSKNPELMLVVCGSISTWIDENILNSTAFYGRISWTISLKPLPLSDCNQLLEAQGFRGSLYEKFKVVSVTDGIPWYLEQIQGGMTADENIKRQCFLPGGVLFTEFEKIFHDLFGRRDVVYKQIIESLGDGPKEYEAIVETTGYPSSGRLSEYLTNLENAGFITRDFSWSLKTGKQRSISRFRLSDNYLRFYLKCIAPRKEQILKKRFRDISLSSLKGWEGMLGLQFENLVLNNRESIIAALGLNAQDIVYDNPYFQRETKNQKGCQIDYLIQTRFGNLYVCEIKFSHHPIASNVIAEMKEKIKRMSLPRGTTALPILIHVNGVNEPVKDSTFFYKILDFGQFLVSSSYR